MSKKIIRIFFGNKRKIKVELEVNKYLNEIRTQLSDIVIFPFIFLDEEENNVPKEKETEIQLKDILDGSILYLKKDIARRQMLGQKIESKKGLDFYLYPQRKLTNEELDSSSNILVIGETGVGKSTWIHSFINYIQNIQLEEKGRYYLFNEKSLQEEYEKKNKTKKPLGSSITDTIAIYNIEPSNLFNNPIRLIDTAGFYDTRGPKYDEKITVDIKNLFESSEIENLNAICLFFKALPSRTTPILKIVLEKLFSLFGEEIKNNIVIIFTFCCDFQNIEGVKFLKYKTDIFKETLGDIEQFPYFGFNNIAYFTSDMESVEEIYENNIKNFNALLKYIFRLKRISLESNKKIIDYRMIIKNNIYNLCDQFKNIILFIESNINNQIHLFKLKNEFELNNSSNLDLIPYSSKEPYEEIVDKVLTCDSGWYVLYCDFCKKICHKKCKGSVEGYHSTRKGCYIISENGECSECKCGFPKHRCKDSYIIKEKCFKLKEIIRYKKSEVSTQNDEEKKLLKEQLNIQIEIVNKELQENNNKIHLFILEGINTLHKLALKNNELNLSFKNKENSKYEFVKDIFKEKIMKEKNSQIFPIFNNIFDDIENLCEKEDIKEEIVKKIQSQLINQKD